jgi:hypothetical protein
MGGFDWFFTYSRTDPFTSFCRRAVRHELLDAGVHPQCGTGDTWNLPVADLTAGTRAVHGRLPARPAASHTGPHLRDIAWRRENTVLALGAAASLPLLIFAPT